MTNEEYEYKRARDAYLSQSDRFFLELGKGVFVTAIYAAFIAGGVAASIAILEWLR